MCLTAKHNKMHSSFTGVPGQDGTEYRTFTGGKCCRLCDARCTGARACSLLCYAGTIARRHVCLKNGSRVVTGDAQPACCRGARVRVSFCVRVCVWTCVRACVRGRVCPWMSRRGRVDVLSAVWLLGFHATIRRSLSSRSSSATSRYTPQPCNLENYATSLTSRQQV